MTPTSAAAPAALMLLPDGPACRLGGASLVRSGRLGGLRRRSLRRWFERRRLEAARMLGLA